MYHCQSFVPSSDPLILALGLSSYSFTGPPSPPLLFTFIRSSLTSDATNLFQCDCHGSAWPPSLLNLQKIDEGVYAKVKLEFELMCVCVWDLVVKNLDVDLFMVGWRLFDLTTTACI
ncbi:hypothetical protein Csa_017088 [Cucumis sativus]|uniref:Uncharacterized protein n=1 Tax=Cucumis sativus TaxID=3659 RepID=A0A0A0K255_CUCSA|nr:hypothetical protein Csa_017088 [Cucumis sativus]